MDIPGMTLAALFAIVATISESASAQAPGTVAGEGTATISCSGDLTASASVSRPNTTVSVTCDEGATVQPPAPEKGDEESSDESGRSAVNSSAPANAVGNIYLGAECTQLGVLSSVCPGAIVTPVPDKKKSGGPSVNVFFPQLPASAQVVCLKCLKNGRSKECKAVINVATAPPQGPQACAVAGSSVTLRINEAGGSAQFACGENLALLPSEATTAYADDCVKEETLKDMTRTHGPGDYFTLKVDKLKKKKVCYLCKRSAAATKAGEEEKPCTIYVERRKETHEFRISNNEEAQPLKRLFTSVVQFFSV